MKITAKELLLKKQSKSNIINKLKIGNKLTADIKQKIIDSDLYFAKVGENYLDVRRVSSYKERYKPIGINDTKCKVYLKNSDFLMSIISCSDFFDKLKYFSEQDIYNNPKKINNIELNKNSEEIKKLIDEHKPELPILQKILDSQGFNFYNKTIQNNIIGNNIGFYKITDNKNNIFYIDSRRFDFVFSDYLYFPISNKQIKIFNTQNNTYQLDDNDDNFFHRLRFFTEFNSSFAGELNQLDDFRFTINNIDYILDSSRNCSDITDAIASFKYDYTHSLPIKEKYVYIYSIPSEIVLGVVDIIDTNGKYLGASPNHYSSSPSLIGYKKIYGN
jgi:hypothetical protein